MQGILFNIQKFCVNDGPGIRTTVFFKGCPLRCIWCHNPESQSGNPEFLFHSEQCTKCGRCNGITAKNHDFVCYNGAKEVCGKPTSVDDVLHEVLKDRIFYEQSGGGLTLSGGEPLYQFAFSLELLKKATMHGLHTAVETCGFTTPDQLIQLAEYTDLFLFDFKETNSALHKQFTGVGNEVILDNLRLLNQRKKTIFLRCPIIPGYNDRPEHFDGICNIANELDKVLRVEIEPYHALGEAKYSSLARSTASIPVPSEEQKEAWLRAVAKNCRKEVMFA